jgi:hypothetical protein
VAAHVGEPDVLADRHADHDPAKYDRLGERTRLEQANFVESAVVGQLALEPGRLDPAFVEQRDAVIQRAVLDEDRADQHRRTAVAGGPRELLQLGRRAFDQRGLEDQVLGRIADQVELGKDDQVGPGRRGARSRRQHRRGVGGKVANDLVGLGEGDLQGVRHNRDLEMDWARGNAVRWRIQFFALPPCLIGEGSEAAT